MTNPKRPRPLLPDDCPIPEYLLDAAHAHMSISDYAKYYDEILDDILDELDDDDYEEGD